MLEARTTSELASSRTLHCQSGCEGSQAGAVGGAGLSFGAAATLACSGLPAALLVGIRPTRPAERHWRLGKDRAAVRAGSGSPVSEAPHDTLVISPRTVCVHDHAERAAHQGASTGFCGFCTLAARRRGVNPAERCAPAAAPNEMLHIVQLKAGWVCLSACHMDKKQQPGGY